MILKQILDAVENCIFHQGCKGTLTIGFSEVNSSNAGEISCEIMNQLGGNFVVESSKNGIKFAVKGTGCPWGAEQARLNPMLCKVTKGIVYRTVAKVFEGVEVETMKTMGHGDDYCYFEIK